jgi:hypothetical protein
MIESAVSELKGDIVQNDGRNIAGARFSRQVDELISVFYDDIGEISTVPTRTLFDLFVIKVLYVEHRSTDASVVDYLGGLLERYLYTNELFPVASGGELSWFYLSDLLQETEHLTRFQNLFEAYRKYGDNSLFVTGIFAKALAPRRRGRWRAPVPSIDRTYYVSTGKRFYHLAARHELADATQQRDVLDKLADYFEVYMQALSEMSERYIMGFDMDLIADKMLDSFNSYRRTSDEKYLDNARRYAAILKLDPAGFPNAWKSARARGHVIEPPGQPDA